MRRERAAISDQRSANGSGLHGEDSRGKRRSFTIIELMVVVGIIILLVGLTVGVAAILNQKSETRQVEQVLKLLDTALQEWELAAQRQMTWGPNPPDAGSTPN